MGRVSQTRVPCRRLGLYQNRRRLTHSRPSTVSRWSAILIWPLTGQHADDRPSLSGLGGITRCSPPVVIATKPSITRSSYGGSGRSLWILGATVVGQSSDRFTSRLRRAGSVMLSRKSLLYGAGGLVAATALPGCGGATGNGSVAPNATANAVAASKYETTLSSSGVAVVDKTTGTTVLTIAGSGNSLLFNSPTAQLQAAFNIQTQQNATMSNGRAIALSVVNGSQIAFMTSNNQTGYVRYASGTFYAQTTALSGMSTEQLMYAIAPVGSEVSSSSRNAEDDESDDALESLLEAEGAFALAMMIAVIPGADLLDVAAVMITAAYYLYQYGNFYQSNPIYFYNGSLNYGKP